METNKIWELAWTDRWTLKPGDKGLTVALWQKFLTDSGFMKRRTFGFDDRDSISNFIGVFEDETLEGTKKYQQTKGLTDTGILDFHTYSKASEDGFDGISVEMAIAFGFNRMNYKPNDDSKFEIVFSSSGNVVFKGIHHIPEVFITPNQDLSANEALRGFRNTFM